jgi:methylated-DNA-protein-cysteine methyltransferase related protein
MSEENFYEWVYKVVRGIPKGKLLTYGQVASILGSPQAAQAVGWALRALPEGTKVPWQRVVAAKGVISIKNPKAPKSLQAELLQAEGVEIKLIDGKYVADLEKYNNWA